VVGGGDCEGGREGGARRWWWWWWCQTENVYEAEPLLLVPGAWAASCFNLFGIAVEGLQVGGWVVVCVCVWGGYRDNSFVRCRYLPTSCVLL
jgi:hypothetical protein